MYCHRRIYPKILITGFLLFLWVNSQAQTTLPPQVLASNDNISLKHTDTANIISGPPDSFSPVNELNASGIRRLTERRKLLTYLKELNVPSEATAYNSHQKFYYHLAGIFAHLKLYPLAMKCFLKTQSDVNVLQAKDDTLQLNPDNLAISRQDDTVIREQVNYQQKDLKELKSKITNNKQIQQAFDDGKIAIAYAMLFHVKQPVPGKRKIFLWANTGHTFITLIKYNEDSTYVSASFGFYPVKDQLLSATPLAPTTSSTFKDDSGHKWDEVLGKFISKRKFEKILALTGNYANMEYNLSNNNCTDFGIQAASIAGIKVTETSGKWPLGSGNNPGVTGQSILQGKFVNTDTSGFKGLFCGKE